MKSLKSFKIFDKKIKKNVIGEKKTKTRKEGDCSTSYPSGNQVDGLPLVAIARIRNRGNL